MSKEILKNNLMISNKNFNKNLKLSILEHFKFMLNLFLIVNQSKNKE